MKNAHLRFGWLTFVKTTEKAVTNIRLRLDRFIGEVLPDLPRQAKAHLISVIGGDTQIAAVSAAISMGERFMVEGPGVPPIRVCLERTPQCYKGSLQLAGRKKPLRHLIGVSEEFAASGTLSGTDRTLLFGLGSVVRLVVTGANSRHPRNSGLGRVVSAPTRKARGDRFRC